MSEFSPPSFASPSPDFARIDKVPTGIEGFDEITYGGLPRGRSTLVTGNAGAGKTLFAIDFLVNGIRQHNSPGLLVTFAERPEELIRNAASVGHDLAALCAGGQLVIKAIAATEEQGLESGDFSLDGLLVQLDLNIRRIGAERLVLDTPEVLFSAFANQHILRREMQRLYLWLNERGITTVTTGERSQDNWSRFGLEEYIADCVILLDYRLYEQISTRRLRVVKYRGSAHGTNEYPFLITSSGLAVLPITSIRLNPCPARLSLERDRLPRRNARRQGALSWQQHLGLGHGGDRQEQPGGVLCPGRLSTRRTGTLSGL